PNARIRLDKTVALVNANFRLFRVPLIWLPYATAPAGRKVRATGFLIPDIGQSSRKGFILGDAFYLAPNPWMDATVGAQFMSRRGVLPRGRSQTKSITQTKALARAMADIEKQETHCPHYGRRGRSHDAPPHQWRAS